MKLTPLFAFLLLPLLSYGQTDQPGPKSSSMEIGMNLGHAFDNGYNKGLNTGGYVRSSVSVLKSCGNLQYGLTVEGGTNSEDYWYMTPGAVLNYKFSARKTYFYAGAMAGYVASVDMLADSPPKGLAQGYVFGLQAGYVQPIGKRLSFTSEVGVRSTQVWKQRIYEGAEKYPDVILYLPVTVGLRYRL